MNRPGSQTPPRSPITRKLATKKTVTWRVTNSSAAAYWVRNNRSRPIGLETTRSMEPLVMRSGKTPAVEISARMVAIQVSHSPTPRFRKSDL